MLREPDPLQPDDQHEHQPAAGDRREEAREDAERERAVAEQLEAEHRILHARLDQRERDEQDDARHERADDERAPPAHRMAAVGADAVGDADHDRDQADGERDVAGPVDRRVLARADLPQLQVRPDGAEDAERDRDEEDQAPVDRRQDAADDEADEEAADPDDIGDPEREPALVGGERVGEDRGGVGEQERGADALHDAEDDQPVGARTPVQPVDRQEERRDGEHEEAERVHAHAPVQVAEPAEADDEDARHDEEAEDHPEEVEAVARGERVEPDAAEDVGHRDEHDRGVDRREQHREGGVRERDPLVAVVDLRPRPSPKSAGKLFSLPVRLAA